jgi:hypothetical protein
MIHFVGGLDTQLVTVSLYCTFGNFG